MSSDVTIGYHGKPRCAWAGGGDTALGRYHDEVWGVRTYDESAMFEALTLGVFEIGLSWSVVFSKRNAFRTAFRGFDVAKVAAMTEREVDRLVDDPSIIRNRGKIQATVDNARAMMSASPGLAAVAESHAIERTRAPRSLADLPTSTPQSEAFAKQLKSQGYRFIGPTSVYAFMQNVGVVNDHIRGCFRAANARAGESRPGSVEELGRDAVPAHRLPRTGPLGPWVRFLPGAFPHSRSGRDVCDILRKPARPPVGRYQGGG